MVVNFDFLKFCFCLLCVASFQRFHHRTSFSRSEMVVDENLLNNKTIILFNLAEIPVLSNQLTASSAKYQVIFRVISQDNC